MTDLNPGSVALIVGGVTTLISATAAAVVSVLAAVRAKDQRAIETTLDTIHTKVNGSADAAAAKLVGLEREIAVLRQLVEAQRQSIQQLTARTEALLVHIRTLDPAAFP